MKPCLEKNDGFNAMDSTHSGGKNEIKEYMTSVSKNVYIDKLDDKVN